MKQTAIAFILAFTTVFAVSCGSEADDTQVKDSAKAAEVKDESKAAEMTVNTETSVLNWKGEKPTGSHNGTVNLKSGTLKIADGKPQAGKFVFDMSSITVDDIEDAEDNAKLTGHLKSTDFFSVDSFPTASFEITEIKQIEAENASHKVSGNLTVKGITKNISFNSNITVNEEGFTAKAEPFKIDRTEWKVNYNSGKFFDNLKDRLIKDDIILSFDVQGKKE